MEHKLFFNMLLNFGVNDKSNNVLLDIATNTGLPVLLMSRVTYYLPFNYIIFLFILNRFIYQIY